MIKFHGFELISNGKKTHEDDFMSKGRRKQRTIFVTLQHLVSKYVTFIN
jgi:hypothetical protein